MSDRYRCIYCLNFIEVVKEGTKNYMICPKCGKRECTNIMMAVLKAQVTLDGAKP